MLDENPKILAASDHESDSGLDDSLETNKEETVERATSPVLTENKEETALEYKSPNQVDA